MRFGPLTPGVLSRALLLYTFGGWRSQTIVAKGPDWAYFLVLFALVIGANRSGRDPVRTDSKLAFGRR
jgi:hypothetical protein